MIDELWLEHRLGQVVDELHFVIASFASAYRVPPTPRLHIPNPRQGPEKKLLVDFLLTRQWHKR
jgi:hypothetical protein